LSALLSRSTVVGLEGRPLTRDEERRIAAQNSERQSTSRSQFSSSRDFGLAGFTALFVLGTISGIAAVFIARFML
jgi:hypothetical protein